MKIIFILLSLLLFLFMIHYSVTEYFTTDNTAFIAKYMKFREIYNNFLITWKQGITTSYGTSLPAGQSIGNPTMEQLNQYIVELSRKDGTTYPPLTDPLPPAKTFAEIIQTQQLVPRTITPMITALQWMNTNLAKAHADMNDALKGIQGFTDSRWESFADICQQIQTCKQVQQQQQIVDVKQWMEPVFDSVDTITPLLNENTRLVAKSKDIQAKAQSGDLLPKVEPRKSPYKLPPGSGKKLSPEQEAEYKQNYSQFFALKQWADQINGVLR